MALDHDAVFKAYPSIMTLDDSFRTYGLDASGNKITLEQSKIDTARAEIDADYAAKKYSSDSNKRKKEKLELFNLLRKHGGKTGEELKAEGK